MGYRRRHSKWFEKLLLNPVTFILFEFLFAILLPIVLVSGDDLSVDSVKINTLIACTFSLITSLLILHGFLKYPGASVVSYVIPSVSICYAIVVGLFFYCRFEYSGQVVLLSFLLTLLVCWGHYFIGRRLYKPKYALLQFGKYKELMGQKNVEWRLIDQPTLGNIRYDGVVADLQSPEISAEWVQFLTKCALSNIPVYHIKQMRETLIGRVKIEYLYENQLGSLLPSPIYAFVKRIGDFIIALIAIPVLSPFMLITAILIKLESPGPILFKQNRVGLGNKDFCIYKFRSMCADSEKDGAQFAKAGDMRVTRVGKVIRKLRIDELPQFFNILKGDMSLIGPRPEQRVFVDQFETEIPFYQYRHMVRPGISGWAQVVQGYAADADDTKVKLEYDFYYIKHFSLWLDILIVFKTLRTIFTGFGAR